MSRNLRLIFLATVLLWQAYGFCSEADYFSKRDGFPDAEPSLDLVMNTVLQQAANWSSGCDENQIYKFLMARLGGFGVSKIEEFAEHVPGAVALPVDKSVYAQSNYAKLRWTCCAPVFRMGETLVGGDKLGHFLHSGFEAYHLVRAHSDSPINEQRGVRERIYNWMDGDLEDGAKWRELSGGNPKTLKLNQKQIRDHGEQLVIEAGHVREDGNYGTKLSGVKSYGDVAANLEGYRFWSNLVHGEQAYFKCVAGRWQVQRKFKFADYVSDAWDEGLNCSEFADPVLAPVAARCPVDANKCGKLVQRYGRLSSLVLQSKCFKAAPQPAQINPAEATQ